MIAVTLTCTGTAIAQDTVITVTSGASFEIGLPSKGSIASLFCTCIDIQGTIGADQYPLPTTLAGVQVRVGGAVAPLFAVAALNGYQQINFQVPHEAELGLEDAEIIIEQGSRRTSGRVKLRLSTAGDFFLLEPGRGLFQHASDYSLVTEEHPARPGEAVIAYLTGLPETRPLVPSGQPAPSEPLAVVPQYRIDAAAERYDIIIDEVVVPPLFIGLAPGLAGVYQINFVVPEPQIGGDRTLRLTRVSCRAAFGSCSAGGGFRSYYRSSPVLFPVGR
ncbi:MAG: hypothetical protein KJZ78_03625 [Bryobacteraceae bacterium]|nr:hypothetical protein [Bryobacteraceae bacterium]